jgi:hypothetical protein
MRSLQIDVEMLAARHLDGLTGPIDADPVVPSLAGIEDEWRGQRRVLARDDARDAVLLHVSCDSGSPDVVAESGGMGEELAKRDSPLGRPKLRLAGRIETLEDLRRAQLW